MKIWGPLLVKTDTQIATAETMLGELILIELCSEAFDEENKPRGIPDETRRRMEQYLATPTFGLSEELRKLMVKMDQALPQGGAP